MTPKETYFDMEGITLIHGDCQEELKKLPDKSVDCCITDPPYEIEAHTLQRRVKRGSGVMSVEPLNFHPITEGERIRAALEISRVTKKWVLVFCQIEAAPLWRKVFEDQGFVYKRTCIWVKPDGMPQYSGDRPGMGYETFVACHAPGKSEWNGGGKHGVFIVNKGENGGLPNDHETQKPIRLFTQLVELFSNDGETVLDPFAGSFTSAVAAKRLGRKYIGIEKEEKHLETGVRRLAQEVLPL